jgi:hypothetical protein
MVRYPVSNTRFGIATSLVLHALFMALLLSHAQRSGDGAKKDGATKPDSTDEASQFVPKGEQKVTQIDIVELPSKDRKPAGEGKVDDNCDGVDAYGGIGIQGDYHLNDYRITAVGKGYPADRAGVKPGDVIVTPASWEIRGEPGTKITLLLIRQGREMQVTMVRDKICMQKEPVK